MLSLSGFLRRLARDSVLAGVEDAMRFLEPQPSQETHSRMVEQLEDRLKRHQQSRPVQAAITAQPASYSLPRPKEEQPPQPADLPKQESNGQHQSGQKQPPLPPRKNGPGRPKKNPNPNAH